MQWRRPGVRYLELGSPPFLLAGARRAASSCDNVALRRHLIRSPVTEQKLRRANSPLHSPGQQRLERGQPGRGTAVANARTENRAALFGAGREP